MALSVTVTGAFKDEPGQKGSASQKEQDFLERLSDLCASFGGHVTGGSLTGDHATGTVGANGRVTWTKLHA